MNDLFISYAHFDDQSLEDDQKGWISKFHRVLEVKISQLMGEQPQIWRDLKLGGNDVYDEKIVQEFKSARLMVSVLSPRYIKSEWCRRELNEFHESASEQEGIKVGDKSRIIKVVKTPFDSGEAMSLLPKLFEGLLGFEFYETDPDSGRTVEFDEAFGPKAKQNYYARIYDLASEITEVLKTLRSEHEIENQETKSSSDLTIFLANCTTDLQAAREKISRELKDRGYRVLPDQILPSEAGALKALVGEDLEQSALAVHLVGQRYGLVPEDSDKSIVEIQNQLSAEERGRRSDFQRFIWMPRGLMSQDTRQNHFIAKIQENPDVLAGAELIEDSLDNFRDCLIQKIKDRNTPQDTSQVSSDSTPGRPSVYLIHDATDEELVCTLEDYLFDQGLEVMVPTLEGNEAMVKNTHIEKLLLCDGVLVFYGHADRTWVDMKIMNLMKAPGYGRETAFKSTAVYLAPPFNKRKSRYRTHHATVITQDGDHFEPKTLVSFMTDLTS
ncbi:TIR domain-containing protein [Verrucomicrobia bacterium]|nr:TIR domain-containing protein [Verrucomicrobiota bacterium]MDB4664842.1 TIR domain-containing protein [Verrucomicrobiota bacterium]